MYRVTSERLQTKDDLLDGTGNTVFGVFSYVARTWGSSGFDWPQATPQHLHQVMTRKSRSLNTSSHGDYYSQRMKAATLKEEMEWS